MDNRPNDNVRPIRPEFIPSDPAVLALHKQRGSAVQFYLICGHDPAMLALLEADPEAFWAVVWDALTPYWRRALVRMLARKSNTPPYWESAEEIEWAGLTAEEREHVCRYTPGMAQRCRQRLLEVAA